MGGLRPNERNGAASQTAAVKHFVGTLRRLSSNDKRMPTTVLTGLDLTLLDASFSLPACYANCVSIVDGRLSSPSRPNELKLAEICAAAQMLEPQQTIPFTLGVPDGAPCLYGSVERLDLDGTPALLLSFVHPEHHRLPSAERLRAWFDLSPTEAAVALEVAQGHDPDQIAAGRELSVLTVRTHLRAIFEKTGARKQRDLVALLLRLAAL